MDMCSPKTISVYEKTIPQRASIDEYYTLPLHLEVKRLAALCRWLLGVVQDAYHCFWKPTWWIITVVSLRKGMDLDSMEEVIILSAPTQDEDVFQTSWLLYIMPVACTVGGVSSQQMHPILLPWLLNMVSIMTLLETTFFLPFQQRNHNKIPRMVQPISFPIRKRQSGSQVILLGSVQIIQATSPQGWTSTTR